MELNRQSLVDLACQYDGCTVTKDRARYVDLLGPNESEPMKAYFCEPGTSGCALTIRGLWRTLGIKDKSLEPPYKFGTAISALVALCRARKGWTSLVQAVGAPIPRPGDFVLVGGDKTKDGGVEHVFTVVSVEATPEGGMSLTSIDGGQRDAARNQSIYRKQRRWTLRDGSWWDVSAQGSDPGSNAAGGRRVMGFGDLDKVIAAQLS